MTTRQMAREAQESREEAAREVTILRERLTVTAGAYSAGDVVGGLIDFGAIPPHCALFSAQVEDRNKQAGAYHLVLFKSLPTTIADNAANDIADADLEKIIAAILLSDTDGAHKFDFADNKVYFRGDLGIPLEATNLYGLLIALGTPTYAATSDVSVALHLAK